MTPVADKIINQNSVAEMRNHIATHFAKLDQIVESLRSGITADEYVRKSGTSQGIQASTPNLNDITLVPPPGYGWLLGRVGIVVTPAVSAGAVMTLYVDYVSLSSLIETISNFTNATSPMNGSYYADSFANSIYIPDGGALLVEWTGMPTGCNIGLSVQGKLVKTAAPTTPPGSKFFGDA